MEKLALERAEEGEWTELVDLAENVPHSIMVPDEFGMLPLHWVCTEPTVPLETLQILLRVYPAACEWKNMSGLLPLHVAIASKLPGVHLKALVHAFPASVYIKGGEDGLFPAEMARRHRLPEHSINVLKKSHSLQESRMSIRRSDTSIVSSMSRSESDSQLDMRIPRISSWESVDKLKSSISSGASTSSSVYSAMSSPKSLSCRMDAEPEELGADLRELSGRLAELHMEMRSSHAVTEIHSVLWNPGDRLGMSLEPVIEEPNNVIGARVKRFTGQSEALGIDAISVGDQLISVNGIDVSHVSFSTVCKFLKKTNVTCKLTFQTPPSVASPKAVDVQSILETTLQKVQNVEDMVRFSSAMTA